MSMDKINTEGGGLVANVMLELMDMKIWFLWRYAPGKNG